MEISDTVRIYEKNVHVFNKQMSAWFDNEISANKFADFEQLIEDFHTKIIRK